MQFALEGLVMIVVLLSLGSCVSQVPVPTVELSQMTLVQPAEPVPTAGCHAHALLGMLG